MFLSNSSDYPASDAPDDWSNEFIQKQENTLSGTVQQKFLENIENFINYLPDLIEVIESYCTESFKDVSLKESVDVELISIKIEELVKKINSRLFDSNENDSVKNIIANSLLKLDVTYDLHSLFTF